MSKGKILIVGTPTHNNSLMKELENHFEIVYGKDLNSKTKNGISPSFIQFDDLFKLEQDIIGNQKCCGDCMHYGLLPEHINGKTIGCKKSYLEAKWGSSNTPACKEDFVENMNKDIG